MALLGVLSIIQIAFLPGYLLARMLRLHGRALETLVFAFALSLIANHALVAGLVALGIYRPASVYIVFALETASLLWCERRILRLPVREAFCWRRGSGMPRQPLLRRTLSAAALLVISAYALASLAQVGQIFQQWDAVVSWNRWAVDWAANRPPFLTSLYPQLLPTNISLSYVFLQSSQIWIFAKAFQFLFCFMLLLTIFDAARATGNFGFVPGVLITYWLLVAVLRYRMLASGYADMPLAFCAFAVVYALLRARHAADDGARRRYLLLGAVLAGGAALAKQTGLYLAAVYPLLAWLIALRDAAGSNLRREAGLLLRTALLAVAVAAPWYLYKFAQFRAARDDNNTALLLTDFHEGRTPPERMAHGAEMLVDALTPTGTILLLAAVAAALADPVQRWLLALVVAPLVLIWAVAFSYDLRNLSLVLPLAGAAAGIGLWRVVEWFGKPAAQADANADTSPGSTENSTSVTASYPRGGLRIGHLAALLTLAIAAACLCVSDRSLRTCQDRQQREVGIPELNRQLCAWFAAHGRSAIIATDYQAMDWLPELGPSSVRCTCESLSAFRDTYDRPEIGYTLIRQKGAAEAVLDYLDGPGGRFVFEACGYRLYEKP